MGLISNHLAALRNQQAALTFLENLRPSISWFGGRHFTHPLYRGYLCMNQIVERMQNVGEPAIPKTFIFRRVSDLNIEAYGLLAKCSWVVRFLTSIKQFIGNATQFARQKNEIIRENEGSDAPGFTFECYRSTYIPRQPHLSHYATKFTVINADTLVAASQYKNQNPAILDMANAVSPGGFDGERAQEEQLVARSISTAASEKLKPILQHAKDLRTRNKNETYIPQNGCLYLPATQYCLVENDLSQQIKVATICAAAPDYSTSIAGSPTPNDKNFDAYRELMKSKIRSILYAARANNHRALILGALGCGMFGNRASHVAQFFKEVFDEEFQGVFQHVCFAIYRDAETQQTFERILVK